MQSAFGLRSPVIAQHWNWQWRGWNGCCTENLLSHFIHSYEFRWNCPTENLQPCHLGWRSNGFSYNWVQLDSNREQNTMSAWNPRYPDSSAHLKTLKLIIPHIDFRPLPFNIPVLHSLKVLHIQFCDDDAVDLKFATIFLSLLQSDKFPLLVEVNIGAITWEEEEDQESSMVLFNMFSSATSPFSTARKLTVERETWRSTKVYME